MIIQAGARDAGVRARPVVEDEAVGGYRHPNRFLLGALLRRWCPGSDEDRSAQEARCWTLTPGKRFAMCRSRRTLVCKLFSAPYVSHLCADVLAGLPSL